MKEKLTPWFPANIKPVHEGVYQTKIHAGDKSGGFQYWNGFSWRFWGIDAQDAYYCKEARSGFNQGAIQWRGLTRKQS